MDLEIENHAKLLFKKRKSELIKSLLLFLREENQVFND